MLNRSGSYTVSLLSSSLLSSSLFFLFALSRSLSPLSVQTETLQPLHQPHDLVWPMEIETAAMTDQDTILRIRFSDGHDSTYQVAALELESQNLANCGVQQYDNKMPTPILWQGTEEVLRIPYSDIVDVDGEDKEAHELHPDGIPATFPHQVFALTERLLTHGHVIITNVPSQNMFVANFAQSLTQFQGYSSVRATNWGPVFNVRSEPDSNLKDLAYTR